MVKMEFANKIIDATDDCVRARKVLHKKICGLRAVADGSSLGKVETDEERYSMRVLS